MNRAARRRALAAERKRTPPGWRAIAPGVVMPIATPATERQRLGDRAWFAARPNRRFRLRAPFAHELAICGPTPEGWRLSIAVERKAPGVRLRHRVLTPLNRPFGAFDNDQALALLVGSCSSKETVAIIKISDDERGSHDQLSETVH